MSKTNHVTLERLYAEDYVTFLVDHRDEMFTLTMPFGELSLRGAWLLFNLIFWKPLFKRGIPITENLVLQNGHFTASTIKRINSEIYLIIVRSGDTNISEVKKDFTEGVDLLRNIAITHLGAFHRSISTASVLQSFENHEVRKLMFFNMDREEKAGIRTVEDRLKMVFDQTFKVFSDPKLKNNVLYPYVSLGVVSPQQLPQVMTTCGTRTDVNDFTLQRSIRASYFVGMGGIMDYASDSLSAKKSIFYQGQGMQDSQYTNRREQLQASAIHRLYPSDCGTPHTVDYLLTELNYKHCTGVYFKDEDGNLRELTAEVAPSYIGKVLKLRNPLVCYHTDGVCHACCGSIAEYMLVNANPGIMATIELMGPVSQLILSNKHFSKTTSTSYTLPLELSHIFKAARNEVMLTDNLHLEHLVIGIPHAHFTKIADLEHASHHSINDQYFSEIKSLMLVDKRSGDYLAPETFIVDQHNTVPYLTIYFLQYIKQFPHLVEIRDDVIWVDMSKFDRKHPILRATVSNDSMVRFTKRVENFFLKSVAQYTSCSEILRDVTNLIYTKVAPHITNVSIVLRSNMVTSVGNYEIPRVEDPDKVMFRTLGLIIPNRSIGGQVFFEKLGAYLSDPMTFLMPKIDGPFDVHMGFGD